MDTRENLPYWRKKTAGLNDQELRSAYDFFVGGASVYISHQNWCMVVDSVMEIIAKSRQHYPNVDLYERPVCRARVVRE